MLLALPHRTAHATELADTRAQALTTQQQLSLAAEEARRQLEREGRQALDVAQTKLEGVQANLRQEVDERTHAQTTNAQLKQQLERVQSELAAVKVFYQPVTLIFHSVFIQTPILFIFMRLRSRFDPPFMNPFD